MATEYATLTEMKCRTKATQFGFEGKWEYYDSVTHGNDTV
jgi:hypothetical protein